MYVDSISRRVRKRFVTVLLIGLILFQPLTVYALSSGEAKQEWYAAKDASRNAQKIHRDAKTAWTANKTNENNQEVIETGKETLYAALRART